MLRRLYPLALSALVAGCVSQQDAQSALEQAQADITHVHTYVMRYAPSAFDTIMAEYGAAKVSFDAGRYREARRRAGAASELATAGGRAATAQKQNMEHAFLVVRDSLPVLLAAIEGRVEELSAADGPPAGVAPAEVDTARAAVIDLREAWNKAARAYDRGDLRTATHAATALLQEAGRVQGTLAPPPPLP
jgi:hypothetical protein